MSTTNLTLNLKVRFDSGKLFDIPFSVLKKDVPLELARYIKEHVVEQHHGGVYNTWSKRTIKKYSRVVRRLYQVHKIVVPDQAITTRRARNFRGANKLNRPSGNARRANQPQREKFGIKIPSNVLEALQLDADNGNKLWAEAIAKEMDAQNEKEVWEFHHPNFKPGDDYQYSRLCMIFEVKQEILRHKARLVIGGHMIDSSMWESYASVIQTMSVRLLLTVALSLGLKVMTGDINNAYLHAPTKKKVWTRAGDEFGD